MDRRRRKAKVAGHAPTNLYAQKLLLLRLKGVKNDCGKMVQSSERRPWSSDGGGEKRIRKFNILFTYDISPKGAKASRRVWVSISGLRSPTKMW